MCQIYLIFSWFFGVRHTCASYNSYMIDNFERMRKDLGMEVHIKAALAFAARREEITLR